MASWFDKSLLLMLSMVNAGIVTLLSWEALLVDRRDALILGSLPISRRLVVAAKAAALARLFGVVAALNLPSILLFSLLGVQPLWRGAGGASARRPQPGHCGREHQHVPAADGGAGHGDVGVRGPLAACDYRRRAGDGACRPHRAHPRHAVARPPSWTRLAPAIPAAWGGWPTGRRRGSWGSSRWCWACRRAVPCSSAWRCRHSRCRSSPCASALPLTLWLWRRALRVLVSAAPGETPGRSWSVARHLPAWLARTPMDRALMQFFLVVLWRSPRHRLAVLTAFGLVAADHARGHAGARPRACPSNSRWLTEYAVPTLVLLCLMAVLRWLLTLPSELPASWVLGLVTPAPGAIVRRAVGRVLLVIGVAPAIVVAVRAVVVAGRHAVGAGAWRADAADGPGPGRVRADACDLHAVCHRVPARTIQPAGAMADPRRRCCCLSCRRSPRSSARWLLRPGRPFVVTSRSPSQRSALRVYRRRRTGRLLTADPGTGQAWTPVQLRIGWV